MRSGLSASAARDKRIKDFGGISVRKRVESFFLVKLFATVQGSESRTGPTIEWLWNQHGSEIIWEYDYTSGEGGPWWVSLWFCLFRIIIHKFNTKSIYWNGTRNVGLFSGEATLHYSSISLTFGNLRWDAISILDVPHVNNYYWMLGCDRLSHCQIYSIVCSRFSSLVFSWRIFGILCKL